MPSRIPPVSSPPAKETWLVLGERPLEGGVTAAHYGQDTQEAQAHVTMALGCGHELWAGRETWVLGLPRSPARPRGRAGGKDQVSWGILLCLLINFIPLFYGWTLAFFLGAA